MPLSLQVICIGKCERICVAGKPCGNGCIDKEKECHIMGTGKACVARSMASRVCTYVENKALLAEPPGLQAADWPRMAEA